MLIDWVQFKSKLEKPNEEFTLWHHVFTGRILNQYHSLVELSNVYMTWHVLTKSLYLLFCIAIGTTDCLKYLCKVNHLCKDYVCVKEHKKLDLCKIVIIMWQIKLKKTLSVSLFMLGFCNTQSDLCIKVNHVQM